MKYFNLNKIKQSSIIGSTFCFTFLQALDLLHMIISSSEYLNVTLFVFSLQESKFRETGVITPEEVVLELKAIIKGHI